MSPSIVSMLADDAVARREDALREGSTPERRHGDGRRPHAGPARKWASRVLVRSGQALLRTGARVAGEQGAATPVFGG